MPCVPDISKELHFNACCESQPLNLLFIFVCPKTNQKGHDHSPLRCCSAFSGMPCAAHKKLTQWIVLLRRVVSLLDCVKWLKKQRLFIFLKLIISRRALQLLKVKKVSIENTASLIFSLSFLLWAGAWALVAQNPI